MHFLLGILAILFPSISGIISTYWLERDCLPGWRIPTGIVIGIAALSMTAFAVSSKMGLTDLSLLICIALTTLPLISLRSSLLRDKVRRDIQSIGESVGAFFGGLLPMQTVWSVLYAAAASLFLICFFSRAMYLLPDGMYSGDAANYGDLPFHIGII